MSVSSEIRLVRHKVFMSQDEFAKALKVAFSTVNRWEAGRTRPNLFAMKQLRAFCKDNHISFEALEKAWLTESQGENNE